MAGQVFVIAEAGVNHNGNPEMAMQLIDEAAAAGADAVKFQTFRADALLSRSAPMAHYQQQTTGSDESQYQMISRLELSPEDHRELLLHCRRVGVEFISTPFDRQSATFLAEDLGVKRLKLASGEVTNGPLLLHTARLGLPIILSTGMSDLQEVEQALMVLSHGYSGSEAPLDLAGRLTQDALSRLQDRVTLLHCTTEYPAPVDEVNLRAMDTLTERFQLLVGYSDHTRGTHIPVAAVARGARVIEKHFTLDCGLSGPDHAASLEPDDLKLMIRQIRDIEQALGSGIKTASKSELDNRGVIRRSLVVRKPLKKGELYSEENLAARRPGNGVSPMRYWELLSKRADRDYLAGEEVDA